MINVCSVCAGEGKPISGGFCICSGKGTQEAEMHGLRTELFESNNHLKLIEENTPNALVHLWSVWLKQNEIQEISAEDLLNSHYMDDSWKGLTMKQTNFVETFINLWEIEHD